MLRARILLPLSLVSWLLPAAADAQSVILEWDPVTLDTSGQTEHLRGYEIGYGIQPPGDYTGGMSVGSSITQGQIDNLQGGETYVFSVKAIDLANNESTWSTEVSYVVPSEICSNLIDDDADGLTDCFDTDCPADTEDGTTLCDGFDNDCDGSIDENLNGPDCPMQDGVCQGSGQPCNGAAGFGTCTAADYGSDYQATESDCDGLDNDCDGSADNGLTAPDCSLQMGVCAGTTQPCEGASGWGACNYGSDYEDGTETLCDDLDNDCDGSVDEALAGCCTEGDTVACSTDEGECTVGEQLCDASGNWSECSGVLPGTESCNGLDDDCDGDTDDGLTPPACDLDLGVCAGASPSCDGASGWGACDYGTDYEVDETLCDDLDNDCDGQTDEHEDCTASPDAGTDAGSDVDAGTDAGTDPDAGTDAGSGVDAGEELVISGGCACQSSSAPGGSLALLFLGLLWAFRRKQ